jgi:single-strand DNA-binding protein
VASFNQIILVGNLTRDPQLRFLPSNMALCDFGVAVNEKYKTKSGEERENVLFVDCVAWGKQAEVITQHMQKGSPILVSGKLKLETWEDKNGGGKRSKHTVSVDSFQFIGSKNDKPKADPLVDAAKAEFGGQEVPDF